MVSKKQFLQKRKENQLKTHLSDGIQEAVSTKKERKIRKSAQNLPFGWYQRSHFYKKEKKIGLNPPFGWDSRNRSYKKEKKYYLSDGPISCFYKKKEKKRNHQKECALYFMLKKKFK